MKTYTDHRGRTYDISLASSFALQDMYADLAAAVEIASAYQARCERLEQANAAWLDECTQTSIDRTYWRDLAQERLRDIELLRQQVHIMRNP